VGTALAAAEEVVTAAQAVGAAAQAASAQPQPTTGSSFEAADGSTQLLFPQAQQPARNAGRPRWAEMSDDSETGDEYFTDVDPLAYESTEPADIALSQLAAWTSDVKLGSGAGGA